MDSTPKLYCAWFCPFAQRAWIAMLAKEVKFEYIEQNPYNKTPEWLAISPNGAVPAIVHGGNNVYESAICIEYIDEAFQTDVSLMPKDPFQRAHARIWGDFLGKKFTPHFFGMLLKQTKEEQDEVKVKLLEGLKAITKAMSPDHDYFQGDTLSYVDIMFAPFAQRISVLSALRGFEVPDTPEFERYHKWWAAVQKHPAFVQTLCDEQKLVDMYAQYVNKAAVPSK